MILGLLVREENSSPKNELASGSWEGDSDGPFPLAPGDGKFFSIDVSAKGCGRGSGTQKKAELR